MSDSGAIHGLRRDAIRIWNAGLDAVRSDRLVGESVDLIGETLTVAGETFDLAKLDRIIVVGAGKAGAGMAVGLEAALGERLLSGERVVGWINVPSGTLLPTRRIRLHEARPAGINEPTEAGVAGSREILRLVESAGPGDLCLCLLSGGGSALLPAPADGITLADKLAVTRHLSAAGANIAELNAVRKQLSRIKGGGLARACRGDRLISLIISDVIGDPLDVIASGPTVDDSSTTAEVLMILDRFHARDAGISPRVLEFLERKERRRAPLDPKQIRNVVIGNNELAVRAAGEEARRLGYRACLEATMSLEGEAEAVGRRLVANFASAYDESDCVISGGEPVVRLVSSDRRGLGGRNQQLVLAAADLIRQHRNADLVVLSAGTDGEDGPTDAAGAFLDRSLLLRAAELGLNPEAFLRANDAYHFFEPIGALLKTGPTHTNVCDLRVLLKNRARCEA